MKLKIDAIIDALAETSEEVLIITNKETIEMFTNEGRDSGTTVATGTWKNESDKPKVDLGFNRQHFDIMFLDVERIDLNKLEDLMKTEDPLTYNEDGSVELGTIEGSCLDSDSHGPPIGLDVFTSWADDYKRVLSNPKSTVESLTNMLKSQIHLVEKCYNTDNVINGRDELTIK